MTSTDDSQAEYGHDLHRVRTLTQEAVDATATAYTEDGSVDVRARLEEEMRERGLDIDDDLWLTEVARGIRSGHHVVVDDDPGSMGG